MYIFNFYLLKSI